VGITTSKGKYNIKMDLKNIMKHFDVDLPELG
jgi:hypothetical protein